jgi:hypothetical protein
LALARPPKVNPGATHHGQPADPEVEQARWKRTRARIGLGFSFLAIPVGIGLLATGGLRLSCQPGGDESCPGSPGAAKALLATGAIVVGGGLAGLGVSANALHLAKRELKQLDTRPPPTALHISPAGATLTHRF